MPIQSAFDTDRALAHFQATGVITNDEVLEVLHVAYDHPAYREGTKSVWDIRGIDRLAVTPGGIRAMAQLADTKGPKEFMAAVITENLLVHGMARMYELIRGDSGQQTGIVKTLEEAMEWLGLPGESPPEIE